MKRILTFLLLAFVPLAVQAAPVTLESDILLSIPGPQGATEQKSLWQTTLSGGNIESHSREGRPDYHGAPWNLVVFLEEDGEARVVFWIDDEDYWLDDKDELLIDERFDTTTLKARSFDLFEFEDGARLMLNLTPSLSEKPLPTVALSDDQMWLSHLCLRHSTVIVDDTFNFGSYSGMGEYLDVGVPGLALVRMSLRSNEEWEPIGTYENGVIEVPLPEHHVLHVYGVRYGPGGFDKGGPFTVFGLIGPPEHTVEQARQFTREDLERRFSGEALAAVRQSAELNPFGGNGRITIGSTEEAGEHLVRVNGGIWGSGISACAR